MPEQNPLPLGVMADTGERLPGIDAESLEFFVKRFDQDKSELKETINTKHEGHAGADDDTNPLDLKQSGWAVMYAADIGDDVKKKLEPLIAHRRKQVGNDKLCVTFEGAASYQPGESAQAWLLKDGKKISNQDVDPKKGVPYYVMIVGSPEAIPFDFQYDLDLFWAVGRLWFPTADEYGRYAASVIEYETAKGVRTKRQMTIFAPLNGKDEAMNLFADNMAKPMMVPSATKPAFGHDEKFRLQPFLAGRATKETLEDIWLGKSPHGPPAILFTGSHGMAFHPDDQRLEDEQGAIICDDWPGVDAPKARHYYKGKDLPPEANLLGMMHFQFDCFGAGWPRSDSFSRTLKRQPRVAAGGPGIARLPQKLLAHPNGGALAMLGHVDRAWSSSYHSAKGGPQLEGFRTVLNRLMRGMPIGHATDKLNLRWAILSTEISKQLQDKDNDLPVSDERLRNMWVDHDDARNYIVFGDPATRLRVDDMPMLAD